MLRIDYQIIRYGITGVLLNIFTYSLYLCLTWLWLTPRQAVTLLYPIGILLSYLSHKKFTFQDRRNASSTITQYLIIYILGYFINLAVIYGLVDILGFPHQLAQILAIFTLAAFSYFSMRQFVFQKKNL